MKDLVALVVVGFAVMGVAILWFDHPSTKPAPVARAPVVAVRPAAAPQAAPAPMPPAPMPEVPASPSPEDLAKQPDRESLMSRLIAQGLFTKTEAHNGVSHLYVGPSFYPLDVDAKASFASVVYAYYFVRDGCKILVLHDGQSGKRVGVYSKEEAGLRMD